VKKVLHVLPHPGGGGETYVDALESMEEYVFERVYLALSPSPAAALRALPRTYWRSLRSADLIHVHGEVASALCLPSLAARRSLVTLHGLNLVRRLVGVKRQLALLNLRLVVRAARSTICVSESEYSDVNAAVGVGLSKRLAVIRNGIDLSPSPDAGEKQAIRAELEIAEETVVGLWVGGLEPVKNPLLAIDAAAEASRGGAEMTLLLAGDGPLRDRIDNTIARDRSGAVRILGHRRDISRLLTASDFYVNSSDREGLAFSVLEAMSMGVTPVVTDAPGNIEAVGDAGWVVPRGDRQSLAAGFAEVVAEETKRRTLGALARQRVATRFTRDEMVRQTKALYDRLYSAR
jgi:glycosyltransferase involved in cell wall biosynthesis